MMHDFTIDKGFSDITIMYCKKCGKSYSLVRYNATLKDPSRTVWEAMLFENNAGEPVQAPKSCEDES